MTAIKERNLKRKTVGAASLNQNDEVQGPPTQSDSMSSKRPRPEGDDIRQLLVPSSPRLSYCDSSSMMMDNNSSFNETSVEAVDTIRTGISVAPTTTISRDANTTMMHTDCIPDHKEIMTSSIHSFESSSTLSSTESTQVEIVAKNEMKVHANIAMSCHDSISVAMNKNQASNSGWYKFGWVMLALCFGRFMMPRNSSMPVDPESIYVPGGGFSGFWFTIGRLQSIPNPEQKKFYCFSAGCLGVVATLSNYTVEEMSEMAFHVQQQWKDGHVDRYGVVSLFLNGLLKERPIATENLSRIHIITSVRQGLFGLAPSVQQARSISHLNKLLLQTTWIPWAVGNGLFHENHMDGAFTASQHPTCEHALHLPRMWSLYLNTININLGVNLVRKFWKAGLEYGISK